MFRRLIIVTLMSLIAVSKAAHADTERTAAALSASVVWLEKLDARDYAATWQSAASTFKAALSVEAWQQASRPVLEPLGAVKSRSKASATYTKTLPGAPDGEYVVLQFNSSYHNKAEALETVVVTLDTDGQWRVGGYFIR